MKKMMLKLTFLTLIFLALGITACKDDKKETEQENITTVVVHLTATDGSLDQEFEWNDADGPGGNAPDIQPITLAAGKTYNCHIHVYDRSQSPAEDITEEIEEENTEHLFVFAVTGANIQIADADVDSNGKPFRLETVWTTGAASSGTVNVVLKHEPDKSAADPNATGETDFDVTFPVTIQ
ncbi:MAG: type 1 periplasmic binding fold superfamily protein [Saprospiraceae bacterium]|nr:type 1 periplasmic binding fold superfamily protein [Saprospiraceae bacterium]